MKRMFLALVVARCCWSAAPYRPWPPITGKDYVQEPREPDCDWYYFEDRRWDPWWEYWCY
jgi:hypothetical protein